MKWKLFFTILLATVLYPYGCTKTVYVIEIPNSSENPALPELEEVDDVCTKMTDENFKEYCYENFDADNDGKVSMKEAKKVTEIDCSTAEDFAGIEYFSNLQSYTSSSVKYIDLRYNLELTQVEMRRAPVKRLDLSYNTKLDSLGHRAFYRCTDLASVTFPKSLTSIEPSVFGYCSSLSSITLPESLMSIGEYAFSGCSSLASIVLPKGVTAVSDHTFYNCTGLTSVDIPESVTTIGDRAFSGCTKLGAVSIKAIFPPSIGNMVFTYNYFSSTLYVPEECIDAYRNSDWTKWFFQILPMDDTFGNGDPNGNDFSNQDGDGTKENPYTVSQVIEMIGNSTYDPDKGYYVKGFLYGRPSVYSSDWWCDISDYYSLLHVLGNVEEPRTSYDGLSMGDKVIVYGRVPMVDFDYYDPQLNGAKIYYWNGVITEVEEE